MKPCSLWSLICSQLPGRNILQIKWYDVSVTLKRQEAQRVSHRTYRNGPSCLFISKNSYFLKTENYNFCSIKKKIASKQIKEAAIWTVQTFFPKDYKGKRDWKDNPAKSFPGYLQECSQPGGSSTSITACYMLLCMCNFCTLQWICPWTSELPQGDELLSLSHLLSVPQTFLSPSIPF